MKVIRFIFNVLTLISSVILLFTIVGVVGDISGSIQENELIRSICVFNLFISPVLTIINSTFNLNKGE